MLKIKNGFFSLLLVFVLTTNNFAQIDISSVGGSVGIMKNYSLIDSRRVSRVYPKLEFKGNLYKPYIGWKVFGGYWNDNLKFEDAPLSSSEVYSYKSYNLGIMLQFYPQDKLNFEKWGIGFNLGYSMHFSTRTYMGGENELGTDNSTLNETRNYLDGGIEVYFKFWEVITPFIEFEGHLPFGENYIDYQIYNLSLGLAYNFGN